MATRWAYSFEFEREMKLQVIRVVTRKGQKIITLDDNGTDITLTERKPRKPRKIRYPSDDDWEIPQQ